MALPSAMPSVAYVAEGKLYLLRPGAKAEAVDSPFVQELHDRTARAREKDDWKQSSLGWNMNAARSPFGLSAAAPAETRRVRFSGITRGGILGGPNALVYVLDTDTVGGLFEYTPEDGYERRLYHRNHFRASDVHCHPTTGRLALAVGADAGTVRLGVTEPGGRKLHTVTEGDAIDQAPSWAGDAENAIVYQSAGLARNQAGFFAGQSPFALYRLDLTTGESGPLLEDEAHDLLLPRQSADGTLHFIRRPYRGPPRTSPWRVLRDVLLFPIGLFLAVVAFLNFFSLMFRQKPLLTAGGPPGQGPDPKVLVLYGRAVAADKQLKKGNTAPPLVPSDWRLVRRLPDGTETVLATGVASYDLAPDGSVVYTDGSTLWHLTATGPAAALGTGRLIERVAVL